MERYRNFGCEFEFSTDYNDMLQIANPIIKEIYGNNRLKAEKGWYKSHNNFKRWHLKLDSSTLSELCTPVSTFSDIDNITQVLSKIGENEKVQITKNDSFHVHMDVGDLDMEPILVLWMKYEKVIFSLFPKHRRNNKIYCGRSIPNDRSKKDAALYLKDAIDNTMDHHSAISFYFFKRHIKSKRIVRNTVEFRLGEGTTDPVFIRNWVLFLNVFLNHCQNIKVSDVVQILCERIIDNDMDGLKLMIKELGVKDLLLKKWLNKRFCKV